jgi:hypothetical protein
LSRYPSPPKNTFKYMIEMPSDSASSGVMSQVLSTNDAHLFHPF